ncbi:MAG: hypothetical protein H8E46_05390 [FCB group bacterium]|nr:hypothetical protein [FCB group bacterium]
MKINPITFRLFLPILFVSLITSAGFANDYIEWLGTPVSANEENVEVRLFDHSDSGMRIVFDLKGAELITAPGFDGYEVEIRGEGHTTLNGVPSLPMISRLIAIPARVKVKVNFDYGDVIVRENIKILPASSKTIGELTGVDMLEYDNSVYASVAAFPRQLVEIGDPAIMRDLRVVRLTVNPVRWNPAEEKLYIYRNFEVELTYEDGGEINTLSAEPQKVSRSFSNLYNSAVLNFSELDLDVDEEFGTILMIAPDNGSVLEITQDLIDWKIRKGYPVVLANTSQTGTTASQIKTYIQNAYNTYEPKLEYLILIGDCAGSIAVAPSNSTGDHDYSRLEGSDILADISVGRFSCANTIQLMVEVNKVVGYESSPYMNETAWYKKGVVTAGSGSGISPIQVSQAIRYKALQNDYTEVDTLWWTMGGSIPSFIDSKINAGVGFMNFRGWMGMSGYSNSNIQGLTNYMKLPFAVEITCGTGDITSSGSDYPEEFFRVGTPNQPTGAIASIGTATTGTHTRFNNAVCLGIFGAIYDLDIFEFGSALVNGKYDLYRSFPNDPSQVSNYSNWNNLIGDPSCQMWTDIPAGMTVTFSDTIPVGSSEYNMSFIEEATEIPVSEVFVCLSGEGIYLTGITDENGEIGFALPVLGDGYFFVTATKHNYQPLVSRTILSESDIFVGIEDHSIDDDNTGSSSGNGDGNANPNETIELGIDLTNFGTGTAATNVSALLSCANPNAFLIQSACNFGTIAAGETVEIADAFIFALNPLVKHEEELPFYATFYSSEGSWESYLPVYVSAPQTVFQYSSVSSPNGRLDPGEEADLTVSLMNIGGLEGSNIEAVLISEHPLIEVLQGNSVYGNLAVSQSGTGDAFMVRAQNSVIPGTTCDFTVMIEGDNGYTDTTYFSLVVGAADNDDPTGPDEYGYYAMDTYDIEYSGHPVYNWIEIDPTLGGSGQDIGLTDFGNEQDDSRQLSLPFEFTYYGEAFNSIGVCSNGWLAFGDETGYYTNFRNWYIPSTLGPPALVAPFWDDLQLNISPARKVYSYYDETDNLFIIEWNVNNRGGSDPPEIFEVVLYDPEYYPTSSGDGIILFQYEDVTNTTGASRDNHYATVGIKSPDHTMGIQYTYWNDYTAGSSTLQDGLAIRFTTDTPARIFPPAIHPAPLTNIAEPSFYYPVYANIESYAPINPDSMFVYWNTSSTGVFTEIPLTPDTTGSEYDYAAFIPEIPPGDLMYYYYYVVDENSAYSYYPQGAPSNLLSFTVGPVEEVLFEDAELENGWSLGVTGDDATTGIWIREDPVESIADNSTIIQPEDDFTADPGHICFVTGNAEIGASGGTNDVDGGRTTLLSPVYDFSGLSQPLVSYWYWYTNSEGLNPNQDYWVVEVSNNAGGSWTTVVNTLESTPATWANHQFWLQEYVTPTSQVQIRFIASDEGSGSLVEACVDDISIVNLSDQWPEALVPASDIHLSVAGDDVIMNWTADPWGFNYIIVSSPLPYFDFEEGTVIGSTTSQSFSTVRTGYSEFYMIKVIR